jgi:hypothetical protein
MRRKEHLRLRDATAAGEYVTPPERRRALAQGHRGGVDS